MTDRVYLHVGGPKSGTTYLQGILRGQSALFAEHGVRVVGREHVELVHAAMVLRGDARLDRLPERARGAWDRVVTEIREWDGPAAVLSYELFSNLSAESAARAVRDLDGIEVHVVITARDLGRAVSSAWQERLKFGLAEPLEEFTPKDDTVVGSEWGWRTLDPASVAGRWGGTLPPEQVHVVTVPRGGDPEELWRRFAEACDLREVPVSVTVERANESLGVVGAEVLRRANPHLGQFLVTPRDKAVWERDLLANSVLSSLGREPLGITVEQREQAQARYERCRSAVLAAGHRVHGDLADLAPAETPAGRTTGEVSDSEIADTACRALAALLQLTRERELNARDRHGPTPASDGSAQAAGPLARGRAVATGLMSRPVLRENRRLHQRIDELEERLDESRRLQQRQAMLTDLVTELLVPVSERKPEALDAFVRHHQGLDP